MVLTNLESRSNLLLYDPYYFSTPNLRYGYWQMTAIILIRIVLFKMTQHILLFVSIGTCSL